MYVQKGFTQLVLERTSTYKRQTRFIPFVHVLNFTRIKLAVKRKKLPTGIMAPWRNRRALDRAKMLRRAGLIKWIYLYTVPYIYSIWKSWNLTTQNASFRVAFVLKLIIFSLVRISLRSYSYYALVYLFVRLCVCPLSAALRVSLRYLENDAYDFLHPAQKLKVFS